MLPSATQAQVKSLLWKISGNGLPQDSYLFGTIHLIPAKDYFLPRGTDSLLSRSKKLVVEMDISDPALPAKMMGAMMLDSGKTLAGLYTPKEYDYLAKKLEKNYHLPVAALQTMKPILVQQSLMIKQFTGTDHTSYEKKFLEQAEKNGIEVVGLETLEDQLAALDVMTLDEQAKALLKAVRNPKAGEKSLDKMVKTYKAQDIEALYKAVTEDKADLGKYEDVLLGNRNRNWIPKIAAMASKETVFIAVGAGHLGGENGVISLLRKAGYTVEPALTQN